MVTFSDSEGKVGYALGGFGHDGEVARTHADVYRYDFREDTWERLDAKLPSPRTQFGLAEHEGLLWVFGGLDYDPRRPREDHFRHVLEVLQWKIEEEGSTFESAGHELPRTRRAFGGARLGDRFYLIGGMREGFQTVAECDVFNFSTEEWETIAAPRAPRIPPELVALDGKLYLAGGSSPDSEGDLAPDDSVEVYDPATNTWAVLFEDLPVKPKHMRMFASDHRLLICTTHLDGPSAYRALMIGPVATAQDAGVIAKRE